MNIKNNIKKLVNTDNCYIVMRQFQLYDVIIPRLSICYMDKQDTTIYFCTRFPNYNGKSHNVILNVIWYDWTACTIGNTTIKNDVSIALYNAWKNASEPRTRKIHHELSYNDYKNMMKHDRKKKKGSGSRSTNSEVFTDGIRYNQITQYAYYENLENYKSGRASMIASNIRL